MARNTLSRINSQFSQQHVSVKDFGAVGDGVTDDTAAIQDAIDTGKDVFFPQGRYIVTSSITVNTRGQALFGNLSTAGKSDISVGISNPGAFIFMSSPATELFVVRLSQVSFTNLTFIGDNGTNTGIGIKFEKLTNTDDIDAFVKECGFYNFEYGIHCYGRTLTATGNSFGSIANSILLDWPSSGEEGDDIQTNDLYKGRGCRISDNRFHGGVNITLQNYVLRSAIITGNISDITTQFIHVVNDTELAGMRGCIIDGNIMDLSIQEPIDFEAGTVCINTVISNNRIGGSVAATIDGTGRRPFAGITFDSIDTIDGLSITGNAFYGTSAYAIILRDTDVVTPTLIKGISITCNLFAQIGLDGSANRAVFSSAYDLEDLTFSHNVCNDLGATVVGIVRSPSMTFTNSILRSNHYDQAIPLVATTTLAGRIDQSDTNHGLYTPEQVATNSNVDSVTFAECQYMRVGNTVNVSGVITIDATAAGDVFVRFSLPVPSTFIASRQLSGTGTENQGLSQVSTVCGLSADSANNCARLRFTAPDNTSRSYAFHFTYHVV